MIRYILPLLIVFAASCTRKVYTAPIVLNNSDSISKNAVTITKIDTVTVYLAIPAQKAERATFAGESHLETDFAMSDAWLNADGSLGHTIANKPQRRAEDVYVPSTTTEASEKSVIIREVPIEVEVARELTWWQRTRLALFWWVFAVARVTVIKVIRSLVLGFHL